ncbi:MAG: bifunctional methionine sulfoxide reductase B/A protein [Phycisphaerales bacterium]
MKRLAVLLAAVSAFFTATLITRGFAQQGGGGQPLPKITLSTQPPASTAVKHSKSGFDLTPLTPQRIDALAAEKKLTDEEKRIILGKGTEMAFCGTLLDNKKEGVYVCRLCGLPLFSSDSKFNSGTGWPSFFRPTDNDHIRYITDASHGMQRTEITCARCPAHLGHVFEDGPKPTGLRYCLNSASLTFFEKGQPMPAESTPLAAETAYFAGGCFWGVEDRFQQLPGVLESVSGYMGGKTKNPTYREVCAHTTGHTETVMVTYDPKRISYRQLLEFFFKIHDPTQVDRQGPDIGDNYRSAIFTTSFAQQEEAKKFIAEQQAGKFKGRKIATQLLEDTKAGPFYVAEDYHQDYHLKHGGHCPLPGE